MPLLQVWSGSHLQLPFVPCSVHLARHESQRFRWSRSGCPDSSTFLRNKLPAWCKLVSSARLPCER